MFVFKIYFEIKITVLFVLLISEPAIQDSEDPLYLPDLTLARRTFFLKQEKNLRYSDHVYCKVSPFLYSLFNLI